MTFERRYEDGEVQRILEAAPRAGPAGAPPPAAAAGGAGLAAPPAPPPPLGGAGGGGPAPRAAAMRAEPMRCGSSESVYGAISRPS
jgi:hypothetical protein